MAESKRAITWDDDWIRRRAWDLSRTIDGLRADIGRRGPATAGELLAFLRKPAAMAMPTPLLARVVWTIEASDLPTAKKHEAAMLAKTIRSKNNRNRSGKSATDRSHSNKTAFPQSVKAVGLPRKFEPYDPDAEDGDGDGLVQDGTPWERPGGTRVVDRAGKEIERGLNVQVRPAGSRIVDIDGNDVDYTPSWLNDEESGTLRDRGLRTIGEMADGAERPDAEKPQPLLAASGKPLGYIPGVPNLETDAGRRIAELVANRRSNVISQVREEMLQELFDLLDTGDIRMNSNSGLYESEELDTALTLAGMNIDDLFDAAVERADLILRGHLDELRRRDMFVAMREEGLEGLFLDGRYKSQHETGTSRGSFNPLRRARIEQEQLGVAINIDDDLRPVYGFVDDDTGDEPYDQFPPYAYGADFVVELKRDLVDRTTLTFGDSLDHGGVGVPMSPDRELQPGDGMAAAGQVTQEEAIRDAIYVALIEELRDAAIRADEARLQREPTLFDPDSIDRPPPSKLARLADDIEQTMWNNPSMERWYDEIQIHGGFTPADISIIWTQLDEESIPEELLELAKRNGIMFRNAAGDVFPE